MIFFAILTQQYFDMKDWEWMQFDTSLRLWRGFMQENDLNLCNQTFIEILRRWWPWFRVTARQTLLCHYICQLRGNVRALFRLIGEGNVANSKRESTMNTSVFIRSGLKRLSKPFLIVFSLSNLRKLGSLISHLLIFAVEIAW